MTSFPDDFRSQQVDAAVAEYLQALERGAPVDREAFLAQHADIAAELREFLDDYQAMGRVMPGQRTDAQTNGGVRSTDGTRKHLEPILPLPRWFADFELLEEIARGGMGVVYKARQKNPNRTVALKMILAGQFASQADVDRFSVEAQAAAALDHPHIVPVFEVGEHAGQHYFTMGYVAGESLAQRLLRGTLPVREAATVIYDVALAVDYAHKQGVIHRDLKPANILVDLEGRVRVTDFGLAKRQADESGLTCTGQLVGTPSFMSPEQVSGNPASIGPASDVYSLGATLYTLVTGRPPFQAASTIDTLKQVVDREPVPPRECDISIPRDLETIVLKCLEKSPAARYGGARALAEDIERFLADRPIVARRSTSTERLIRWCRRNPVVASLSATVAAALVVGTTLSTWQAIRATRAEREQSRLRQAADTQELATRQAAYASDMNLAHQALVANNLGRAHELLDRHRPQPGQRDLRGWEWRYLWQQGQSDSLYTLCQRPSSVYSLAVSHDGQWLAVGEFENGNLSIWDLQTRQEIERVPAGEAEVHVAFSPRERLLAFSVASGNMSQNRRQSVRLWDPSIKQIVAELPLRGSCVGIAFSGDGQTLITDTDRQITLWRVPSGMKLATFAVDQWWWFGSSFAVTRDLSLAAYSTTHSIGVIDLATGQERWSAECEHATCLAFSPDGKTLASASGYVESPICLWDVVTGKELGRLTGHDGWVSAVVFFPDGRTLASASSDQTIRLWDIDDRQALDTLRGHRLEVWSLALLADGTTLVSGCKDGSVCVWDTATARRSDRRVTIPGPIRRWNFAPNSKSILTVSSQGQVVQWQGAEFEQQQTLLDVGPIEHSDPCFSPDGRWLATGGENGIIQVWDLRHCKLKRQMTVAKGRVHAVHFVEPGNKLFIRDDKDDSVHEWDLETWQETRYWPRQWTLRRVEAFSSDGRLQLTLSWAGKSFLLDTLTNHETNPALRIRQTSAATFSPDGKLFAGGSVAGFAKLWETSSLREVATFKNFSQGVNSVAFSPDSNRLAVGSDGKEAIKLWDVESHGELLTLPGDGSGFSQSLFSPDGNVLGASNRSWLHLWLAPSWDEIEAAERDTAPSTHSSN